MKAEPKVMSKSFWVLVGVVTPPPAASDLTRMATAEDRKLITK